MSDTDPAVIGVQSCGCITFAHVGTNLQREDEKALMEIVRQGGSIVHTTVAEAKQRPHFLVSECPHDPKGWQRKPQPSTEPCVKSFKRVESRGVSRVAFANIKGWERFSFGEVRKWDGKWWATDGWFNHGRPGAHDGMLSCAEHGENGPTLHLGPFATQRDAANALVPHAVRYAAALQAKWAEQRKRREEQTV